jgi:plasmid stabilization system protein ParE
MEGGISYKPYAISDEFFDSQAEVYNYGAKKFGYFQAECYNQQIEKAIETLSIFYLAYPECRHLATKNRIYRNIILDAHLIIYRITDQRIEVLNIVHAASNIGKIRNTRKIHI